MKRTMRRKVTAILRAPIPGTMALERRLGCWLVASVKFVWWALPGVAVLLAVWIVGGNFLAAQQEQEIERAWEEFAQDWPEVEMNDSALKLAELARDMGINLGIGALYRSAATQDYLNSHPDFAISETSPWRGERFRQEITAYLDALVANPNDDIEVLPESLQRYLAENAETLEAIRSHILNRELPQRGTYPAEVILEKNYAFVLESGLGFAYLQRILQLSMMDRTLRGQHQTAEEILETSWKLNQTLLQEQNLISQLVHLIFSRQQIGTMRRLEPLSPEWQQRLSEYDFRPSLLKSLEPEIFSSYGVSKDLEFRSYGEFERILEELVSDNKLEKRKFPIRLFFWFRPIIRPYHRFSTVNSIQQFWQELAGASRQPSICQSDDWVRQTNAAWWSLWTWWDPIDSWDEEYPVDFINQERKVAKFLVEVELTQKILQAKGRAAELGRWPETLPNLESRICPGERWVYRVSEEGTMSLSLSREPPWLAEHIKNGNLPLEFRTNRLPVQR